MNKKQLVLLLAVGGLLVVLIMQFMEPKAAAPLDAGYVKQLTAERATKDRWLKFGDDSPLPPAARDTFSTLPYYAPAAQFVLEAQFTPSAKHDSLMGMAYAGALDFTFREESYNLAVAWQDEKHSTLFLAFTDSTSRLETYGGGRYLTIPLSETAKQQPKLASTVKLDLNRAYHPYCVYAPDYVCPAPPKQNRLPFAVRAGEKLERVTYHNNSELTE